MISRSWKTAIGGCFQIAAALVLAGLVVKLVFWVLATDFSGAFL